MSEKECFEQAIYHMRGLRACFSGLANLRKDVRWLYPVRILEEMEDRMKKLFIRGGPRVLWLPDRRG